MPATSSSPDIFFMLFLESERRVKYFRDGKLTILSMQFEERDSFSTRVRVLKTEVYSLSIGGI